MTHTPTTPGALQGQVAFITGAGSGLGAAFARRLARDGATIVINDLSPNAAAEVAAEVGGETAIFDVCDSVAFDAEIDKAVARHGRIDILVNNAGIAPPTDTDRVQQAIANQMARMEGRIDDLVPPNSTVELSDEDWDRMIKVHLYGTFYGTRAALRHMTPARSGAVVNVSSVLGLRPMAGAMHYATAKAGIIALTKSVGQEVAPYGIRVNAVCPGWIDTPLLGAMDPMMMAGIVMQIPKGRMGRPDELAELVRFLCGPESSYCNGDVFAASGGFA
ncbi:MAG TPA: SDR family NAD(P)-dependent oxidoreductase [Ilumatobacteraceae bacterium]|nr:SDR family NAD(P)-dependent oxidoreductase [Ilumatobacteraceae bacterium]